MKFLHALSAVFCIQAAQAILLPKLPNIQNIPYKPPAKTLAGYTPKTTIYKPVQTKDGCKIPGLGDYCSTTPTAIFTSATATSTVGCATTDAACLNCALAYQSQAAAASYDPYIFQRPFEDQAAALCYQYTISTVSQTVYTSLYWAPGYYDAPNSYCTAYWNSVGDVTSMYSATYFLNFCTGMGNVLGVASMFTDGPTIVAARATNAATNVGTNVATGGTGGTAGGATSTSSSSSSGAVSNRGSSAIAWLFAAFGTASLLGAMYL